MREVLFRVRGALSDRGVRLGVFALWLLGGGLALLPLLGIPGYELATGLCLLQTFLGPALAMRVARISGRGWHALLSTTVVLLGLNVLPLTLATVRTWVTSPCDPWWASELCVVLLVPTAFLIGAQAHWVAQTSRSWWSTASIWVGSIALSAGWTVWPIVSGPQVFAFNHYGGFLPGPIYDEALGVTSALLWFRLGTLVLALALGFASTGAWLRAAVLAMTFALLELNGPRLGFRATDDSVQQALGGTLSTSRVVLHHPSSWSTHEKERALGDLEFRSAQIAAFLGAEPSQRVTVWWYRDAEQKQRLVGAGQTQFAKPWRHEVHINAMGFPHPVLKHELAHAMAAEWGAPPFGVTGGLFPNAAVLEGFAVAADDPVDDLTLHEWAAAMRARGLLPDVVALMQPGGFYATAPSRAYTTAGSLLRFVEQTFGKPALRRLYRSGDFEAALGVSLEEVAADYVAFLDTVSLDDASVNQAFQRFNHGSLFERPCAREVSALLTEVGRLSHEAPHLALTHLERCRALQPQEPAHALARASLLETLGRPQQSLQLLEDELRRLTVGEPAWANAALARAERAVAMGDDETARRLWETVLANAPPPAIDRTAHVWLESLTLEPSSRAAVQRFFDAPTEPSTLELLRAAVIASPHAWAPRYLLGRRLVQQDAPQAGWEALASVTNAPPTVVREVARLRLEAAFALGRCEALTTIGSGEQSLAFRRRVQDWVDRCAFDTARRLHDAAPEPHF